MLRYSVMRSIQDGGGGGGPCLLGLPAGMQSMNLIDSK